MGNRDGCSLLTAFLRPVIRASLVSCLMVGAHAEWAAAQVVRSPEHSPEHSGSQIAQAIPSSDPAIVAIAARHVHLDVRNIPLQQVLDTIAAQAGLKVMFNQGLFDTTARITMRASDISVRDAFRRVLEGTGLEVVIVGTGEATVVARENSQQPTTGILSGRVIDSASGRGVSAIVVSLISTKSRVKLSVTTDSGGRFVLRNVLLGAQSVLIKGLGYQPVTRRIIVEVGHPTTMQIVLTPTATILSGVVTTATGTQRKVEIGNTITTINVDSVMQTAPISSLTDLLETRVPGLTVLRTSGVPGAPARIRLRGSSSITRTSDPIVVVDGVPMYTSLSAAQTNNLANGSDATYLAPSPFDQIDPSTIDRIEVLDGPSATAMYGSNAANGVIVITTKRGRVQPLRWTVVADEGIQDVPGQYPDAVFRFGWDPSGLGTGFCPRADLTCAVDSVVHFQALNDPRYTVLGRGSDQRMSVGMSGGTTSLTYNLTGTASSTDGYLDLPQIEVTRYRTFQGSDPPDWMQHPDQYKTLAGTGTIQTNLTTDLSATIMSSLYKGNQRQSSLQSALSTLLVTYVDPGNLQQAPLVNDYYTEVTSDNLTSNNTISFSGRLGWFRQFQAQAGVITNLATDEQLTPRGLLPDLDSTGAYRLGRLTTVTRSMMANSGLDVQKLRLNLAFGFDATIGNSTQTNQQTDNVPIGISRPTNFVDVDGLPGPNSQSTNAITTYGMFLEPRLALTPRLFFNTAIRFDNNSGSGSNATWQKFPKVNASWLLGEEPFFHAVPVVSTLRVHAAYGVAGVQPQPSDRLRLLQLQTINGELPSTVTIATVPVGPNDLSLLSLGNTKLRPERAIESEEGIDLGIWNDRLQISVTGSQGLRDDALISVPLASSLGVPARLQSGGDVTLNVGAIRKSSLETTLDARLLEARPLQWTAHIMTSRNRNIVTRLAPQVALLTGVDGVRSGVQERIVPGYPLFGDWARPIVGIVDADHNGIVTPEEIRYGDSVVFLGRQEPDYTMTVANDLSFLGGVSAHVTVFYQHGVTQFNTTGGVLSAKCAGISVTAAQSCSVIGGDEPGASLSEQAAYLAARTDMTPVGMVQVVNTLRLQSLSVNYAVPSRVTRRFNVHSMLLSLQGSNLWLKTNYRGKDPDVNDTVTGNTLTDTGQLPQPREWTFRIQMGI